MQMTNELLNPPTELRAKIERAGCRFVIQAGFHPGILAALVRHATQQMDAIHSAIVGSVIRDRDGVPFTSGFFVAGFNWVADYLVTSLIVLSSNVAPMGALLQGMLQGIESAGGPSLGPPSHLFYVLIGAVSTPYALAPQVRLTTGQDPSSEEYIQTHIEMILRLFIPERL